MLNYSEFKTLVQEEILKFLPAEYSDGTVRIEEVKKLNGVKLDGLLVIRNEDSVTPTIYLNGIYENYIEGLGDEIEHALVEIASLIVKNQNTALENQNIASEFRDFDYIKDKIVLCVVNAQMNEELLKDMPHVIKEDLACIYKVLIDGFDCELATITVLNQHLDAWGVTEEEIHALAEKNSKKLLPPNVMNVKDMFIKNLMASGLSEQEANEMCGEHQFEMHIVSNQRHTNGASVIFYEENILAELADRMNDNLFVIPSSIHEVIVMPAHDKEVEELNAMVREVNETEVDIEERLSNNVYFYNAKQRTLEIATYENTKNAAITEQDFSRKKGR